ncbi:hypothetical protein DFH09DRAFT_1069141 [Mycena vulgaris]|nr:hypothetical protein DFH09DRAFT_1069141 [Mycena vulgaris]
MASIHLPDLDAFYDLEDVEEAAQALCLVVTAFVDPMLKECHLSRNFDLARNHTALRRHKHSLGLNQRLSELLPVIRDFVAGGGPAARSLAYRIACGTVRLSGA